MHVAFRRLGVSAIIAACSGFALSAPLGAQNTITLEGSVKGEGAAPVASAQITVVNVNTRESQQTLTRASGEFRILGLFSGQYTVNVRAIGYRQRTDTVNLVIGQRARLEFQLDKGAAELESQMVTAERVKQVEVQRHVGIGAGDEGRN